MAGTMAEELYQALQGEPYVKFPKKLDPDSGVEWDQLPKIMKNHWWKRGRPWKLGYSGDKIF